MGRLTRAPVKALGLGLRVLRVGRLLPCTSTHSPGGEEEVGQREPTGKGQGRSPRSGPDGARPLPVSKRTWGL